MVLSFFDNIGGLWMCALFVVSSQRWRCHTNAVTVRARYLPCFVATLVLYVHAVSSRRWSCQKNQSLYVHVISSRRWSCQKNQSLYVHVICSKLVLRKTSLCMYTLFVPSWCSDKPVSASYFLCPHTTLVLSDKPVTVCARYLLSCHNIGAVRRTSLNLIFEPWYHSVTDINNNMKFIVLFRRLRALCQLIKQKHGIHTCSHENQ